MVQVKEDERTRVQKHSGKVISVEKNSRSRSAQGSGYVPPQDDAMCSAVNQERLNLPLRCEAHAIEQQDEADTWASLTLATGTARRARGLLFGGPHQRTLLLVPCNDVHTVGMRHAIDVAFLDRSGRVIEAHRKVGPMRRLRNNAAVAVVERFASCPTPWFSIGDQVVISNGKEG